MPPKRRKMKKLYFYQPWFERLQAEKKAKKAEQQKKYDANRKPRKAAQSKPVVAEDVEVLEGNIQFHRFDDSDPHSGSSETDESQESGDASYEPCQKKSKKEVGVEAATHSLALDINNSPSSFHASFDRNNDDVSMEVVPLSNNYSEGGYAPSGGDAGRPIFNQMIHFAAPLISVTVTTPKINVTIPSVNIAKTRISRSKVSGSKITQEQTNTEKTYSCNANPSKKTFAGQVTPDSNRAMKSRDKAPSNQEDRYKYVTIRKPRKLPQRRESVPTNEEPQNDDSDTSLNSDISISGYSGDISEEEESEDSVGLI